MVNNMGSFRLRELSFVYFKTWVDENCFKVVVCKFLKQELCFSTIMFNLVHVDYTITSRLDDLWLGLGLDPYPISKKQLSQPFLARALYETVPIAIAYN